MDDEGSAGRASAGPVAPSARGTCRRPDDSQHAVGCVQGSFVGASGLVVGAMGAGDEAEGGDSTAAAYRDPCGAGQLTTNAVVAEAETLAAAAEPAATEPEAEAAEAAEAALAEAARQRPRTRLPCLRQAALRCRAGPSCCPSLRRTCCTRPATRCSGR